MTSLIVVCPHCLTWAEPHADRCTECGIAVDIDAPDPDEATLAVRLGEPLMELGPVRLDRKGWPSLGQLVATSEGLLFVPDLASRPNGAVTPRAEESEPPSRWISPLSPDWWRPQPSRVAANNTASFPKSVAATQPPPHQRLLESPGGLFVQRTSIRRLLARWNHLQIERRPARSVTLRPANHGAAINELVRRLRELPIWRGV